MRSIPIEQDHLRFIEARVGNRQALETNKFFADCFHSVRFGWRLPRTPFSGVRGSSYAGTCPGYAPIPCWSRSRPSNSPSLETRSSFSALSPQNIAIALTKVAVQTMTLPTIGASSTFIPPPYNKPVRASGDPATMEGTPKGLDPAAEYSPLANKPSDSVPQIPQAPCTGQAPTGSSMRQCSSRSMARITITPATAPIAAAPRLLTQ